MSSYHKSIRLRLEAYDHRVLDRAVTDIIRVVQNSGVRECRGPIPLPVHKKRFIVNRSPFIDKESREQFEIRRHARILDIDPNAQTVDALMKLELPYGVEIKIKLLGEAN
jgi:small subunit ribosomal protein S10